MARYIVPGINNDVEARTVEGVVKRYFGKGMEITDEGGGLYHIFEIGTNGRIEVGYIAERK